jgi:16S rRNA (cytosine967-C5)-methyltransferase
VKWRVSRQSLKQLSALQLSLLQAASKLAHRKGVLVYMVCSPEPEETREVVRAFLKGNSEWRLEPADNFLPSQYVYEGCFRLIPGESEFDGFFAARMGRRK